eukprot:gb/GECH01011339.1/.p1 GENE.gb/GECH01011339.1/~~gb/GECH01011339.1/.p1  ORF type:complete len:171 (+),score=41.37 gb/GECH01011339.1/:1-513(+)
MAQHFKLIQLFIIFLLLSPTSFSMTVQETEENTCNPEDEPYSYKYANYIQYGTIAGTAAAGMLLGGPATVLGIKALGFGSAGVTSGSLAAGMMSSNVVSGSVFAACQSIGATGAGPLVSSVVGGVLGSLGGQKAAAMFEGEDQDPHCECGCKCPWRAKEEKQKHNNNQEL